MWAEWLHHPCRLRGPQRSSRAPQTEKATNTTCEQRGYIIPAVLGPPTLSASSKIRIDYPAHMWAKWPHQPCRFGGPQRSAPGQETKMATWPICGQNGYITCAVSGVPNAQCGDKNQKLRPSPQVGKVATSPLPSRGSQSSAGGQWLPGPYVGKVATSPLPSWGSPRLNGGTKVRDGYLPRMWAIWLLHRCRLEGPQCSARGQKRRMATYPTYG